LIFLDEIERLLPASGDSRAKADEFNACFGALRALSQQRHHVSLLVADVHPDVNRVNRWPQDSAGTNPVYSFFKEVFLEPFSERETGEMLDGLSRLMGWRFDQETAQAIHASSGGHPFVSRQLASLLRNRLAPTDGDTVGWSAAARYLKRALRYSGPLKDYFGQNVWADLERRDADASMAVLRLLAERDESGLTDTDLEAALVGREMGAGQVVDALLWLDAVGLVSREEEDEDDRFRLRVPLLGEWLKLQFGHPAPAASRAG